MATEAGGPRFWVYTLQDNQAAFDLIIPELDDTIATEDTLATAFATASWSPIAPALDQATIKFISEWEDIRPLHSLFRTGDVEKLRGLDTIQFNWGERDFASLAAMLRATTTTTVGGAAQAAQNIIRLGTNRNYAPTYYHAAALLHNENGLATVIFFMKVRVDNTWDLTLDNEVCKLPVTFKVMAWDAATAGREIVQAYEFTEARRYTLTYSAGANGSITGTTPQVVARGASGTAVEAVADSGYDFEKWSDDSTQNPRTDTNVTVDVTVTASFVAE